MVDLDNFLENKSEEVISDKFEDYEPDFNLLEDICRHKVVSGNKCNTACDGYKKSCENYDPIKNYQVEDF